MDIADLLASADEPLPATARRPWLVVGVGATQESDGALTWALQEAARRDGTVLAVTVWAGGTEEDRQAAERELLARVQVAVEVTGVRGRTRAQLVTGSVTEVLTALSDRAEVLVLGQHHLDGPPAG